MFYLDEDINIRVAIASGVVVDDSIAAYQLKRGDAVLFTGSCFLPAGTTSKTIRVNELLEDHKWKNDFDEAETDFSQVAGLVDSYSLSIQAGTLYSTNFQAATIYRYPRYNTPGLMLFATPDRCQMMVDGYDNAAMTYKLEPHIPYLNSGDFKFPLVFESDTTERIQPCVLDYDGHTTFTESTSVKVAYNVANLTVYQLLGQTQLDRDADLYLAKDGNTVEYYAKVAHIDYCPARFYLVWQDRYGGTQSQPFTGTCTYVETISRTETLKSNNKRQIASTTVQPKFTITSNWLNFKTLPYFEGLFVSPWLQLWDTETGISYDVIITNSDYTEATFKSNNRQMYSYTLDLEVAKKQNILY